VASVLVVEDDALIGQSLREALAAQGHAVEWVTGGTAAVRAAAGTPFDLVLLDLGLDDLDGVEVARRVRRAQPATVIVMLTARADEIDVVVGLDAGADDYLIKPFRMTELLARLRAHLRRGPTGDAPPAGGVSVGLLDVDVAARRAYVAGAEVVLRTKEFDLLARLAADAGTAVRRETLMADVWDAHWFGSTKTLDVHVAALRRRLVDSTPAGGVPPAITTVRGFGYRLEVPD
jgi:DNA-binding response OmpR family regulator